MLERAWLRRSAVILIAATAGVAYGWQANRDTLEIYYAAAVRSMSMSWHDFIFGGFDPAGTVSLDKLPGAFWLQASDRGRPGQGRLWRLLLAGAWVGLAFQAKMIEAWLLLPVFALAYLIDGPDLEDRAEGVGSRYLVDGPGPVFLFLGPRPAWRRLGQLATGGGVAVVVSLAWMAAVTLVPAASRPYADGSHDNSVFYQVFVYNGFGRFSEQTPLQLLAGQIRPGTVLPAAAPGPGRLLTGSLGRDTGWLLLTALAVGLWALATRIRQPSGDPQRACLVLWAGWLLVLGVTFSFATVVNSYYTAALSPAIAALLGVGLTMAWSAERAPGDRRARGDRRCCRSAGSPARSPSPR